MADKLPYSVVDNKLTIDTIHTNSVEGDINLDGSLALTKGLFVADDSTFAKSANVGLDLVVGREIQVPILRADTLITKTHIEHKEPVVFSADNGGVEGKGIVWKHDKKNVDFFIFKKDPNRIFTNLTLDLYRGANYSIDGTPVISVDTLGPSFITSSLRKVGRLKELTVDGDVILGEHVFLDSTSGRLGIGTDHANAAFSLVDNNVEIILGSADENLGTIGTYTSHDLGFVTDNTTRMKITRSGKVVIGDPRAANADVTINGKLYVKELVVDIYEERQSPLEFKAIGSSNYGKGIIFSGSGVTKQFILASSPDNFYSSEHINLESGKIYMIGKKSIISENEIGHTVTKSHLTSLGTLNELNVNGNINLNNVFKIFKDKINIGGCEIDTVNGVTFKGSKITLQSNSQSISVEENKIILGDKNRPLTHADVNGKLSVGIQTKKDNRY